MAIFLATVDLFDGGWRHVFGIMAQHRLHLHRLLQLTHVDGHIECLGQLQTQKVSEVCHCDVQTVCVSYFSTTYLQVFQ